MRSRVAFEYGKPWEVGELVGGYRLLRQLARGGMAELFVAETDDAPDSTVVLKRIRPDFSDRLEFVKMFDRETRLLLSLDHPNVVKVLDVGEYGPDAFIAMEHLRGCDLRGVVRAFQRSGRRLPLAVGTYICMQLLRGLQHVHERTSDDGTRYGIIHRDISPSNVFVTEDGSIKLLDFGIAKSEIGTQTSNSPGPKGKGCYMAPEQCRGDRLDQRADIFSTGAVLYELTTMRRAFPGPNDMAILKSILDAEVDPPSKLVPSFPPDLESVVMKSLEHEREDRFATAADMLEALEEAVETAGLRGTRHALIDVLTGLDAAERNAPLLTGSHPSLKGAYHSVEWPWGSLGPQEKRKPFAAARNNVITRTDGDLPPAPRASESSTTAREPVIDPPKRSLTPALLAVGSVLLLGLAWQRAATADESATVRPGFVPGVLQPLDVPPEEPDSLTATEKTAAIPSEPEPVEPTPTPTPKKAASRPRTTRKPPKKPPAPPQPPRKTETPEAPQPDAKSPATRRLDEDLRAPNL